MSEKEQEERFDKLATIMLEMKNFLDDVYDNGCPYDIRDFLKWVVPKIKKAERLCLKYIEVEEAEEIEEETEDD